MRSTKARKNVGGLKKGQVKVQLGTGFFKNNVIKLRIKL